MFGDFALGTPEEIAAWLRSERLAEQAATAEKGN